MALSVMGLDNPYRTLLVCGRATTITTEGANEHIDALSKRYTGNERDQRHQPGIARLKVTIEPIHVRPQRL